MSVDPLSQRRLLTGGIGGVIKERPEDFLVEEQPLYTPSGEGEHVYLLVEKRDVSHTEMMSCLRRHFDVHEKSLGFSGMKDKIGVTRQMVSLHMHDDPPSLELPHERIRILGAERHANKLRRGHLAGNRFSIRIRQVDPLAAPVALKSLRALEQRGIPNAFGAQRFGYRRNNHILGAAWLDGRWRDFLDEMLGTSGSPYPAYQEERRQLYEERRYRDALELWSAPDRAERRALAALGRSSGARKAVESIGRPTLGFFVSALQSAVFNRVLDARLERGAIDQIEDGDLAYRHDSRAVFRVDPADPGYADLVGRCARLEISPSGPLWGRGMTTPEAPILDAEIDAMAACNATPEMLVESKRTADGRRRPLRVPLGSPEIESGVDEHGAFVRVAFDLPRGAYATIALREITGTPDGAWERSRGEAWNGVGVDEDEA